jgi:hypothetical protein
MRIGISPGEISPVNARHETRNQFSCHGSATVAPPMAASSARRNIVMRLNIIGQRISERGLKLVGPREMACHRVSDKLR